METFTKGEIVLFLFPYTVMSERKIRPCLVISDEFNEDLIFCQVTSQKTRNDKFSIKLGSVETNLRIDSFVRCNMIFTASKKQITRKISKISSIISA